MLEDTATTERIIGAAMMVHQALGPGFLGSVYAQALAIEFDHLGIRYERRKPVSIQYRRQLAGEHRLDFLVEENVIVEIKAGHELEDFHLATIRSCLKAGGLHSGLLLNFATMPLTIQRVGREEDRITIMPSAFDAPLHS